MNVMREYWAAMVDQARAGNVEAARDVLEEFCGAVEDVRLWNMTVDPEHAWSGPIPWVIAEYLAGAFKSILNDAEATKALHLVASSRGRPEGTTTHNAAALAAAFFLLVRNGLKPEEANAALCKKIGADRATIYRARREFAAYGDPARIDDEVLRAAVKPYASKVTTILERRRTK